MQLTLYKMTCDKNVVDKSDYITEKLDILGNLRENTNIVNPVITIKFYNESDTYTEFHTTPITSMIQFNYCYIPEFGRYYFIDDVEWIGNCMHNLYLTIDVLYTFRGSILNLECGITRNEFKYTPYLPDDMMPVVPSGYMDMYAISTKLYNETYNVTPNNDTTTQNGYTVYDYSDDIHQFLLITSSRTSGLTINGSSPTYTIRNSYVSPSILRSPICCNSYTAYFIGTNCYNALSAYCEKHSDVAEKIVAIYFCPISITQIKDKLEPVEELRIGTNNYNMPELSGVVGTNKFLAYKVNLDSSLSWKFDTPINVNLLYNKDERLSWVRYKNIKYNLYIPFFGIIDFNPFDFFSPVGVYEPMELCLFISLEPFSGTLSYSMVPRSSTYKNVSYSGTTQLNQFPITYTNYQEIQRNKFLSVLNLGLNTVSSVITRGTNIASTKLLSNRYKVGSKNYKKAQISINKEVAGGASDLISSVGDVASAFTQIEHTNVSSNPSDYIYTITKLPYVFLIKSVVDVCINDSKSLDKYAHIYGLPYCAIETLSDLHGYTVCADFHLDNIYVSYTDETSTFNVRPTSDELDMIEEYLKTGIILP